MWVIVVLNFVCIMVCVMVYGMVINFDFYFGDYIVMGV